MRFIINGKSFDRPVSKADRRVLADMLKREGGIENKRKRAR